MTLRGWRCLLITTGACDKPLPRVAARQPGTRSQADRIHGARAFVPPNPSGLNASFPSFAARLRWKGISSTPLVGTLK